MEVIEPLGDGPRWEQNPSRLITIHPVRLLVFACTADGYLTSQSPAWAHLTGRSPHELAGHGWLNLLHPDDREPLQTIWQQARRSHAAIRQNIRLRDRDGRYLRMVIDAAPLPATTDGEPSPAGWMGCCIDAGPLAISPMEVDLADDRIIDLLRESRLPAVVLDVEGRILFLNEAFADIAGRHDHELIYREFFAVVEPPTRARKSPDLPGHGGRVDLDAAFETSLVRPDGSQRVIDWHAMPLRDAAGKIKGYTLLGEDNTEERRNEAQLRLTQRVFETTSQAMVITDRSGAILSVNNAFTRLTGYAASEAIGNNPRILQSGRHDDVFYEQMWQSLAETGHWQGDIWDRRKDGSTYPKFLSISAICDKAGEVTHYAGIFYDITQRKAIEESLDHLANHDPLTGLANRALFQQRLEQAIAQALRTGTRVALLYLDLDHFKAVNDHHGHDAGDALLKEIANRLSSAVRANDTVARLGGDEFVVVLPQVRTVTSPAKVARKLLAAASAPVTLAGQTLRVTPSIGISLYPDNSQDIDVLLRQADQAMYRVKAAGRSDFQFFESPPAA